MYIGIDMAVTPTDRMQVAAFFASYKMLYHLSKEERFLTAICLTSDDRLRDADPALVDEWLRDYGKGRRDFTKGSAKIEVDRTMRNRYRVVKI